MMGRALFWDPPQAILQKSITKYLLINNDMLNVFQGRREKRNKTGEHLVLCPLQSHSMGAYETLAQGPAPH